MFPYPEWGWGCWARARMPLCISMRGCVHRSVSLSDRNAKYLSAILRLFFKPLLESKTCNFKGDWQVILYVVCQFVLCPLSSHTSSVSLSFVLCYLILRLSVCLLIPWPLYTWITLLFRISVFQKRIILPFMHYLSSITSPHRLPSL